MMDEVTRNALEQIGRELANAESAVIFTGAGISTESGLPDYRGADGLWKNKRFEELAHIETFKSNPVEFWAFYRQRLEALHTAMPNKAHIAVASLFQDRIADGIITQNVDGLHLSAMGSANTTNENVVELHGSLRRGECLRCGLNYRLGMIEDRIETSEDGVPRCDCGYPIRPSVVLFGESLPQSEEWRAKRLLRNTDYILCLGSSLKVRPASSIPESALLNGGKVGIINDGPTSYDGRRGVTKVDARLGEAMPVVHASARAARGIVDEDPDIWTRPSGSYDGYYVEGMTDAGRAWLAAHGFGDMVSAFPNDLVATALRDGLNVTAHHREEGRVR